MPKSVRTQIIEAMEAGLWKIKAGQAVPNLATGSNHKFLSTVRSVNRAMFSVNEDKYPALFLVDPAESGRHMMADILQQTMKINVAGAIKVNKKDGTGSNPYKNAVEKLDDLVDDTRALLVSDPTWGGLARRSRIPELSADASTDDTSVAFGALYEVDYIEVVDDGSDSAVELPTPLPADSVENLPATTQPWGLSIINALFNAFLTIPGIVWVEKAKNWPIPLEQISARYTPGVWFKDVTESYQYQASRDTKKFLYVTGQLLAVDTNLATFTTTIDTWVAALKNCLGTYADLGGRVATVDITAIRPERSEYPVVVIELDLTIMYVQSFLIS
jgi:hypothetical protein